MKRFSKILLLSFVIFLALIIVSNNKVNAKVIQLTENGYMPEEIVVTNRYDYAKEVFNLVNNEREKNGKSKLRYDKTLTDAAMRRAAEIYYSYSHTRPNGQKWDTISEYVRGENLGIYYLSPESFMNALIASEQHEENVLRDYFKTIGVGCVSINGRNYWVQLFGKDFTTAETRTDQEITNTIVEVAYSDFKINPVQTNELNIGETLQLSTTVVYEGTTYDVDNSSITYTSSDENVASVVNGKVTALNEGNVTITAVSGNNQETIELEIVSNETSIRYRTHVQNDGWQNYVKNGKVSGTTGQGLRLEAINIVLKNPSYSGNIEYSTHVQNIGWQDYKKNGETAGTSGQSLRLEAIKIRLTGELAKHYDIYYRVHSQIFGWMNWAKNDEAAGTQGYSYRLEAIEIVLVNKGENPPYRSNIQYSEAFKCPRVSYQTHVEFVGWQDNVAEGEISGTSGQSLRLEGIKINLENKEYSGNIEYCTHVQNIGWQNYVRNGRIAGTSGQGLRLEAIKIRLTGEMAKHYDIYYRVHSQNIGWMGWAKNDEAAGTEGLAFRLEAIQIQLVKTGESAPGTTKNAFVSNI